MNKPIWAIVWPDGKLLADSTFKDEDHAWQIALGWPSEEEILAAKAAGYKAVQVEVQILLPLKPPTNMDEKRAPDLEECCMDELRERTDKPPT
jgi:hypothetical protein